MMAFRAPRDRLRFRTALLWRIRLDIPQSCMMVRWSRMAIGWPRYMEKQLVVIYVPVGTPSEVFAFLGELFVISGSPNLRKFD